MTHSLDPLISPFELAESLGDSRPSVILDVRWSLGGPDREAYDAGHVPGAVFVDLDAELAGRPGEGGRHPLPDPKVFEQAMRRAGVSNDREVAVYDASHGGLGAARAWWLLRYFGHERVRVLDGGWAAWNGPVSTETPQPEPGEFTARPGAMPVVDAAGAAELARSGTLIDVRSHERFRGEQEPIDPVAGHIPGAVNLPGPLDPSRLRDVGPGPIGAYCGSGVTAAQAILALEAAGHQGALYAGSWSEWIVDPSRPVATGP